MAPYAHTVHVVFAGIWLGSLLFTTLVVSPALRKMDWRESDRVQVRSRIGRQFLWLANPVLLLMTASLLLDGLASPLPYDRLSRFLAELALLAVVALLSASHGFLLGTRLRDLAAREVGAPAEDATRLTAARRRLQRISYGVSIANLIGSAAIAVLSVNL